MPGKRRQIISKDIACKGAGRARKPARKTPGLPNVCYAIRPEGSGQDKTYATEVFSGKDGKSLGFVGPECSLVPSRDQAVKSNYLNRWNAENHLRDCMLLESWNRDRVKRFRGQLKAAQARPKRSTGKR